MEHVTEVCSRCGKAVNGLEEPGVGTGGFYRVATGVWSKYAQPGESILCDECMGVGPIYRVDYGQSN